MKRDTLYESYRSSDLSGTVGLLGVSQPTKKDVISLAEEAAGVGEE